ncbi:sulfatase family protein [Pirellulimonas nuda]|uniref:sulfatase family protein n=1 Tax=Pirellulimonas nuda TaxID=2528009 RepID=UPI0018D392C0|nr:sulfatase-like hydrolase/transferase [Pirellulimonas nuda]
MILIISDDQGFPDYGFMGNEEVQTPNLDRMAGESLLYTRGYVMPVCSPSLACLLTGKLPHEHRITGNDLSDNRSSRGQRGELAEQLLSSPTLLPKMLTDAGYLTLQTGKLWNVTYADAGFTHGMTDTAGRHGDAGLGIGRQGMEPIFEFIDAAQKQKAPFFVWYAPFMPHVPHTPPKEILDAYRGRGPTPAAEKYYAMVEWFDQTCGQLDQYLEEHGLKENTVVLYLADNGWDGKHGQSKARAKLSPYELGIRTPMFVRWPGKVAPARDDATLAHIIDFVPTILDATGVARSESLAGLNLTDREAMQARQTVFVESYTHDIADLDAPEKSLIAQVVIDGQWKLIAPGPVNPDRPFSSVPSATALFNLAADPLEENDVASEHPEIVEKLLSLQKAEWNP